MQLTHRTETAALDLESFAAHAGRTTVSTDDVLLMTRRNDALHGIMQEFIETQKATKPAKGKGAASGGKGKGVVGRPKK